MQIKKLVLVCAISSLWMCDSWAMENEDENFNGRRIHQQIKHVKSSTGFLKSQEPNYFQSALDMGSGAIAYVIRHPMTSVMLGLYMQTTMVGASPDH